MSPPSQPAALADVIRLRAPAGGQRPRTLVLIPCLNEAPRIAGVVEGLRRLHPDFDVLVVDDGSTDETAAVARAAGAEILRLPHHLGYGAALQTGYKWALQRDYDRLIQMDGDGQHPVEEVQTLLDALEDEDTDLVLGSRFGNRPCYRIPLLRLIGIRFFAWLTSRLVGRAVTDPTSGFQAMKRGVFRFYQQDFYPYDYPDADMLIRLDAEGLAFREVAVRMESGPPDKSMHSGVRPVYYVYKLVLSMLVSWLMGARQRR